MPVFERTTRALKMVSFFDLLFLGAIALVLLYLYLTRNRNYWKKRGIATDENVSLLFGSMTDAFLGNKSYGGVFDAIYKATPGKKVVGWFKFQKPGLLVRDPELIRRVLVTDFNSFRNNDIVVDSDADPIMGKNIFVLRDDMWKKHRALVTPAFTAGKIKAIYPAMVEVASDLVEFLKRHPEEIQMKPMMSRYTSEVVARCAFGIEGNNLKDANPEMAEIGKEMFDPSPANHHKMMAFFLMPGIAKLFGLQVVPEKALKFFDGVLRDVIVYRQQNNIERNDLVSYLIEVKRKSMEVAKGNIQSDVFPTAYSDDDVLSGCIMFFIEAYETSALVTTNVLHQLAINKDVQDKLRAEVDEVLKEGELTFEKLHGMTYLHSVYAETNRLLPVTYAMRKITTENYEMDVGMDKPLVIEKDTPVIVPIYSIHNDPLYWSDPDTFDPDRFSEKEEALAKAKGIYMPFSDGPRMCPGTRIATTMVKLAVVKILSKLEVLPTSKTPQKIDPDPSYFLIAHKGGIYLRFIEMNR